VRTNLFSSLAIVSPHLVFSSMAAFGLVLIARPISLPAFGMETSGEMSAPIEAIAPWLLPSLPAQSPNQLPAIAPEAKYQASVYRQRGLADRQAGLMIEAIASLSQATRLDPSNINGYVLLGWTQHLNGDHHDAAQSLWRAIRLDPQSIEAFNALGIVYLVQGNLNHAVLSHSWAAILKPDNEIAYYNLSLAYQRQRVYDWAIAYGKAAALLEPYNPHPFVALAVCYWDRGDQTQAIDAYAQALSIDPRYGEPGLSRLFNRGGV
jgi:tetratricopeptide (TPR) repeat protein